jgi:hypothetical protein
MGPGSGPSTSPATPTAPPPTPTASSSTSRSKAFPISWQDSGSGVFTLATASVLPGLALRRQTASRVLTLRDCRCRRAPRRYLPLLTEKGQRLSGVSTRRCFRLRWRSPVGHLAVDALALQRVDHSDSWRGHARDRERHRRRHRHPARRSTLGRSVDRRPSTGYHS